MDCRDVSKSGSGRGDRVQRLSGGKTYIRKIDWIFFNEREIRCAVIEAREAHGGHTGGGTSGHACISDPTAIEAIRNVTELKHVTVIDKSGRQSILEHPEEWLDVIERTRRWAESSMIMREILRRRYSNEPYTKTCAELAIEQSSYSRALKEIRTQAAYYACYARLIDVDR